MNENKQQDNSGVSAGVIGYVLVFEGDHFFVSQNLYLGRAQLTRDIEAAAHMTLLKSGGSQRLMIGSVSDGLRSIHRTHNSCYRASRVIKSANSGPCEGYEKNSPLSHLGIDNGSVIVYNHTFTNGDIRQPSKTKEEEAR